MRIFPGRMNNTPLLEEIFVTGCGSTNWHFPTRYFVSCPEQIAALGKWARWTIPYVQSHLLLFESNISVCIRGNYI